MRQWAKVVVALLPFWQPVLKYAEYVVPIEQKLVTTQETSHSVFSIGVESMPGEILAEHGPIITLTRNLGESSMIISDLNYLEVAQSEVTGAQGININSNFNLNKNVRANVRINEDFRKRVNLDLRGLRGNGAEVLGSADAQGKNTFTSIIFGTQTEPGKSESFVNASSFTNNGGRRRRRRR